MLSGFLRHASQFSPFFLKLGCSRVSILGKDVENGVWVSNIKKLPLEYWINYLIFFLLERRLYSFNDVFDEQQLVGKVKAYQDSNV